MCADLPEWKPVPCTMTSVVYGPCSAPESSYEKQSVPSCTVANGMVVEGQRQKAGTFFFFLLHAVYPREQT